MEGPQRKHEWSGLHRLPGYPRVIHPDDIKLLAFAVDTLELHLLSVKREKDGEKLKIDLMNLPRPGYPWSTPGSALPTI